LIPYIWLRMSSIAADCTRATWEQDFTEYNICSLYRLDWPMTHPTRSIWFKLKPTRQNLKQIGFYAFILNLQSQPVYPARPSLIYKTYIMVRKIKENKKEKNYSKVPWTQFTKKWEHESHSRWSCFNSRLRIRIIAQEN
jgi:hypothetical protein